jgi:hypothetical protein
MCPIFADVRQSRVDLLQRIKSELPLALNREIDIDRAVRIVVPLCAENAQPSLLAVDTWSVP